MGETDVGARGGFRAKWSKHAQEADSFTSAAKPAASEANGSAAAEKPIAQASAAENSINADGTKKTTSKQLFEISQEVEYRSKNADSYVKTKVLSCRESKKRGYIYDLVCKKEVEESRIRGRQAKPSEAQPAVEKK